MGESIAVLGGGVAGLSAAHELAERGFEVRVYERNSLFGGKARSLLKAGSGTDGRSDLPGEHGFRFFPGFYRHVIDTMRRIPYGAGSVFDNLTAATRILLARGGREDTFWVARVPDTVADFRVFLGELFTNLDIPAVETAYFVERMLVIATSCQKRREEEYEKIAFWDFIGAAERSPAYQKYLAEGLTRSLVAMRAQESSTRTVGPILLQLLYPLAFPGESFDRLLTGPTNDVWIFPWIDYLRKLGVQLRLDVTIKQFLMSGGRISGVELATAAGTETITADYYVAAMPVEVMASLVSSQMKSAAPSIANLGQLKVEWMNGIQFYLNREEPLCRGHVIYLDSPWALTSISQRQFWRTGLEASGNGNCRDILSVDVSDWNTPGILYGKPATQCTPEEIRNEVLQQVTEHVSLPLTPDGLQVVDWFLDPDIRFPNPSQATNLEPLLINTVDSFQYRPSAQTEIPNLFLASDYVRTNTNLATMEAANEAARRAVNAILDSSHSPASKAAVFQFEDPVMFRPAQDLDAVLYSTGHPHVGTTPGAESIWARLTSLAQRAQPANG
ncbi:MAG: FAD-dependent oxidoreductase [Bryobacteraceae bacterium]